MALATDIMNGCGLSNKVGHECQPKKTKMMLVLAGVSTVVRQ